LNIIGLSHFFLIMGHMWTLSREMVAMGQIPQKIWRLDTSGVYTRAPARRPVRALWAARADAVKEFIHEHRRRTNDHDYCEWVEYLAEEIRALRIKRDRARASFPLSLSHTTQAQY
jgi:hypothetical protein